MSCVHHLRELFNIYMHLVNLNASVWGWVVTNRIDKRSEVIHVGFVGCLQEILYMACGEGGANKVCRWVRAFGATAPLVSFLHQTILLFYYFILFYIILLFYDLFLSASVFDNASKQFGLVQTVLLSLPCPRHPVGEVHHGRIVLMGKYPVNNRRFAAQLHRYPWITRPKRLQKRKWLALYERKREESSHRLSVLSQASAGSGISEVQYSRSFISSVSVGKTKT